MAAAVASRATSSVRELLRTQSNAGIRYGPLTTRSRILRTIVETFFVLGKERGAGIKRLTAPRPVLRAQRTPHSAYSLTLLQAAGAREFCIGLTARPTSDR